MGLAQYNISLLNFKFQTCLFYIVRWRHILNMMPSSKRVRIRDVWIDWYPGHIPSELPHNTRLLPAIPDLDQNEDTDRILIPQEPPPAQQIEPPMQCGTSSLPLVDNLLRGVGASQWIRTDTLGGIVNPVQRFTNGSQSISGWNILNPTNISPSNNDGSRPLIYTLPVAASVNQFNFHYSAAVALTASNWIPSIIGTYPIQVGGITIRLFDTASKHLADVVHKPRPDVAFAQSPTTGPFDFCIAGSRVVLRLNKLVRDVKFIHIHFHGRHVGLAEIEALPLPSGGPPPTRALVYFPAARTVSAPALPVTPFSTALFSHFNPFTNVEEPGTKVLGSNFGPWQDNNLVTFTGHSGSTPMATIWVTLTTVNAINGFRFYKFDDTSQPTRRLDVKPSVITFYDSAQSLIADYTAPVYTHPDFVANNYYVVTLRLTDSTLLASGIKYIKFDMQADGFLRNIHHFDVY